MAVGHGGPGSRGSTSGKPGNQGGNGGNGGNSSESKGKDSASSTGPDTGRRGATTGQQENDQQSGLSGRGNESTQSSQQSQAQTQAQAQQDRRAATAAAFANPEDTQTTGDPNANTPSQQTEKETGFFSGITSRISKEFADFKADPFGYAVDVAKEYGPEVVGAFNPPAGLALGVGVDLATAKNPQEAQKNVVARTAKTATKELTKNVLSNTGLIGTLASGYIGQTVENYAKEQAGKPSSQQSQTNNVSANRRSKAENAFSDRGGNRGMNAGIGGMAQPGFSLSNFDPTAYASHYQGMQANNPNAGLLFTT